MNNLRHNRLVIVGIASIVALFTFLHIHSTKPESMNPGHTVQRVAPVVAPSNQLESPFGVIQPVALDPKLEQAMVAKTARTIEQLSEELAALLREKQYDLVREQLLQIAAQAIADNDKNMLGNALSLLGQVAIEEQDLDTAEVYLLESLDVYEQQADKVGSAQVFMQLGRVHLHSRQLARTAGDAYDRLLVARWQLSHGQYALAEHNLTGIIEDNLSINRFGAAASAYSSLARVYAQYGATYNEQQAAVEAARLFAASGQIGRAKANLAHLEQSGVERWRLSEVETEIHQNFAEFQNSVEQIERARDYRQLYNHYQSQGDEQRAWKFRILASKTLRNVSKRAMYHRQPDVLALLYVSNDAKERARNYFDAAMQTFDSKGLKELSTQTKRLKDQIL